ncbi:hypothetical protein GOV14_05305 [Candidatus Pacearchaeota archaeon]|nr:hypothetical protein [Candidatus Pacearchaeota archaeon]
MAKNLYISLIFLAGVALVLMIVYINPNPTGYAMLQTTSQEAFNLEVDLPKQYQKVPAGEDIWFTTKVLNLANKKRIDVTLKYEIYNSTNNVVISKTETVAIETQASFVGKLRISEDIKPGNYILKITLLTSTKDYETQASFRIIKNNDTQPLLSTRSIFITLLIFITVAVLLILAIKSKLIIERLKIKFKIKDIIQKKVKNKQQTSGQDKKSV